MIVVRVLVVDTEWGYRDGRLGCETAFEPVVLCAHELESGEDFHFWGEDHRLASFVAAHAGHLWVAHSATAEMKFLLRQGITPPPSWFCTMTAFRAAYNRPGHLNASLLDALAATGLSHLAPTEKMVIRDRILHLRFDAAQELERAAVVDYCFADVRATAALFGKLRPKIDQITMAYWSQYLHAVAKIELRGVPIDSHMLGRIVYNRFTICRDLRNTVNKTVPVYRWDGSFSRRAFFRWIDQQGISWPPAWSIERRCYYRPTADDAFESMETRHPFIAELREVRKTLRSLGKFAISVDGRAGRHYYSTMPFRSVTGRNQPSKFVFCGPKWMRWTVVPSSIDHVLVYVDYSAQELGIAAALSGDAAMATMYAAPDPHIAFAVMAGAAPAEATKESHPQVRKTYKSVNLAVLYSQTEVGIAERLGISQSQADDLLEKHKSIFSHYHAWSERIVSAAYDRRFATTPCGWKAHVPPQGKWRTWANFPIQGSGADIMRLTTIGLDQQNVQILAIVHDGWLLTCRRSELPALSEAVERARAFACEKVVKGFPLRLDWTIFQERFEDDDGLLSWGSILMSLPKERLYVPDEGIR